MLEKEGRKEGRQEIEGGGGRVNVRRMIDWPLSLKMIWDRKETMEGVDIPHFQSTSAFHITSHQKLIHYINNGHEYLRMQSKL